MALEGTQIYVNNLYLVESEIGGSPNLERQSGIGNLPVLDFLSNEFGYPNKNSNPYYTVRDNDTDAFWSSNNLMSEFHHETGPENSVMFGNEQVMIKDIKKLVGVKSVIENAEHYLYKSTTKLRQCLRLEIKTNKPSFFKKRRLLFY